MAKINVLDREVGVVVENDEDYICITDIARHKNAENIDDLIRSWLRNCNTARVSWHLGANQQPGF